MYDLNVNMEPSHKLKNLKSIIKSGIVNHLNNSIDKKFLFENYIMLTDRPGNYSHVKNKSNIGNINTLSYNYGIINNNINEDLQNEYSLLHNKNINNINNKQFQVNLISTSNNNNNSKSNIISRTERKSRLENKLKDEKSKNEKKMSDLIEEYETKLKIKCIYLYS